MAAPVDTENTAPNTPGAGAPIEIRVVADSAGEQRDAATTASAPVDSLGPAIFRIRDLSVWYGTHQAVRGVSMDIPQKAITAIIGPSGCGKSTALRCLNRMNDLVPGARVGGSVLFGGEDVLSSDVDPVDLRGRIGMVFQKPNPFPKSISDNIEFGMKVNGIKPTDDLVEQALRDAALWDEVKDRLKTDAFSLSGGQQQRLCIARAIATGPEVLLMDEPCSALDPIATAQVEELIDELRAKFSVVIVTHSMQQAARVSQKTAFFHLGNLVEYGNTSKIFTNPDDPRTESYITGRIG